MIVSGRAEMGPADPPAQAMAQLLLLRHRLAATAADIYAGAGFSPTPSATRSASFSASTAQLEPRPHLP
jgi:hypothetical protein